MAGKKNAQNLGRYETVRVEDLRQTRRGKHHEFVAGVLADLQMLKAGSAIKIPLRELDGSSIVKLRSAINRGAASKGMKVSTMSDAEYFYVWPQGPSHSRR